MRIESPPEVYSFEYMQRLIKQIQDIENKVNRKDVTMARLRITELPTSATGLSSGDLWNDLGTVKVV